MSETKIKINVLLFGACREAAGAEELVCEVAAPVTVGQAWAELKRGYPALGGFAQSVLFAVNEEHVRAEQALLEGDTLAIFPPVSGG
jgi:molybdopterin converting factor subunit 1